MIFRTAGGLAVAFVIGFALVAAFWPLQRQRWSDVAVRLALASGIGLGVSSVSLFLTLSVFGKSGGLTIFVDVVICLIGLFAWWLESRRSQYIRATTSSQSAISATKLFLGLAFTAAFAIATIGFGELSALRPHGGPDAWYIWNLHARFLFRGQDLWTDMFSPLLANYHSIRVTGPVSKPDYPLLVSASIARLWNYAGGETLFAPALIAGVFTFSTAALLTSVLVRSRSTTQGLLAGLVLLGTPAFVAQGASQYADVPLAFFFLATLALLYLYDCSQEHGYLLLAGSTAGLGAWTKNEGLVLLVVVLLVRFVANPRPLALRAMLRRNAGLFVGMAPPLVTVIYFKVRFAPPNDMVAGQGLHAIAVRVVTLSRYVTVGKAFVSQVRFFGDWFVPILLVLAFYALLVGGNSRGGDDRLRLSIPLMTVLVATTGYFFVYIESPHQLAWHLGTSHDRVLMQLWPSALFGLFLLLNTPEEAMKTSAVNGLTALMHEVETLHPAHH